MARDQNGRKMSESRYAQSESRTEVLTWFGNAASFAQMFEYELCTLLCLLPRLSGRELIAEELDGLAPALSRKTCGQLLEQLKQAETISLPPLLEERLREAIKQRNHLMHGFFAQNAERALCEAGRTEMIKELRELSETFKAANFIAEQLTRSIMDLLGLPQKEVQRYVTEYTDMARGRHEA